VEKIKKKLVIFTDLDGTLLDSGYSFKKAVPALRLVQKSDTPLILCSSKTRVEVELYRKRLGNRHPFISENGGGIFIPKNYFKFRIQDFKPARSLARSLASGQSNGPRSEATGLGAKQRASGRSNGPRFGSAGRQARFKIQDFKTYRLIKIGTSYPELRVALEELRSEGFDIQGFGDMSVHEVASLTGLKTAEARMAKQRDFDEPFVFKGTVKSLMKLKRRIISKGFRYTEGEFLHITGDNDKGRAVRIIKTFMEVKYHGIITAALGDSPNDLEMLREADYPVVIKKAEGKYDTKIIRHLGKTKKLIRAEGIGPEGWNDAVSRLLDIID
jgi:mannosyl-3-phosphoglycerate phosphatase